MMWMCRRRFLTRLARSMASSIFCIWLFKTVCFSPNALSNSLIDEEDHGHLDAKKHPSFVSYLQQFMFSVVDQLSIECVGFINIMLGFTMVRLEQQNRWWHLTASLLCLPGVGYKLDQPSVANVSSHSNVVECFRPYFVVWLLDVILRKQRWASSSSEERQRQFYLHRLKGEIRDLHVRDQLYCMCGKLTNTKKNRRGDVKYRDETKVSSHKDEEDLLGMLQVAQKYFNVSFLWLEHVISRGSLPLESSSLIWTT